MSRKSLFKKQYYQVKYSDGFKAIVPYKPKKSESAETGAKITSIKKIQKPGRWQRFKSW